MATKTDSDRAELETKLRKLPTEMTRLPKAKKAAKAKKPAKGKAKAAAATPRADSKQAKFIAAMRTARGMSITEAAEAFDWQPHTVRGAIAGAIKKRLKLKVEAEQDDKRGTVYRIKK